MEAALPLPAADSGTGPAADRPHNEEGIRQGVGPISYGSEIHTEWMKTQALKQPRDAGGFDAVFGGALRVAIRWRKGRTGRWMAIAALGGLVACGPGAGLHRTDGESMGTRYAIAWSGGPDCGPSLADDLARALGRVDAEMSHWRADSLLSRFNDSPADQWFPVSEELAGLVALALDLSRRSDGAFDISAAPLVDLWGFGAEERPAPPEAVAVEAARRWTDYRKLEVRLVPPALKKGWTELRVDLSAIAKGHAVDHLARLLDGRGCNRYLIELGGELRTRGRGPAGVPWRIGIEAADGSGRLHRRLSLSNRAAATSGDYRNFRLRGGERLSHILDPRTGRPVVHGLASATVVADSAALADGLATLILVLGPQAGFEFAARRQIAALLLIRKKDGFEERYTAPMLTYLEGVP